MSLGLEAVLPLLEELKDKAGLLSLGERSVYVEPLDAQPVLLLCGGGDVSLEVATLAHACGFVVDEGAIVANQFTVEAL